MKVFVVGATGEVGSQIVKQLLENAQIDRVMAIVRRPLEQKGPKLEVRVIEDFSTIKATDLAGYEAGFSALGTTRAKNTSEQFRIIDHDYPVHLAKMAKEAGCLYFGLVSSTGASPTSWFPELRLKAETEQDVVAMGPPTVSIFRPAFLVCQRAKSSMSERFTLGCVVPLFNFFAPGRYSIETSKLAAFMIQNVIKRNGASEIGPIIYENSQITAGG